MTFKEKLKMEHPEAVALWARGGCIGCPSTYGYEKKDRNRCPQTPECWTKENCTACWNREIPGTEPKFEAFKTRYLCEWHTGPTVKMKMTNIRRPYFIFMPKIKKVIFNDPATIVIWADGEKTVVKCQNGEPYDPEKGLAMAITKRALGNKGNYFDEIKKWTAKA